MHAVIMTGGKGMRMRPYTEVLPKGLLPVGERPILETIVKQLAEYGFHEITMACGYLAPLIQTYFGDGSKWGVSIDYYIETHALGTIGALKHLPLFQTSFADPFLVVNCDVLTTLNFQDFYQFHQHQNSLLTIASQVKDVPIHLGVLRVDGIEVIGFAEKPTESVRVSMGMYAMDPAILPYIPKDTFCDVPDVIAILLTAGRKVCHYANDAFWFDIGRPEDYQVANRLYAQLLPCLLPGEVI